MKTLLLLSLSLLSYKSIAQCANYTLVINYSEPSCFEMNDGDITLSTTGGNGGDVYQISFEGFVISAGNSTVNQLTTGWYYFDVTNNAGCQLIDSLFLDQPGELEIEYTVTNPDCYGAPTGSIVIDTVYNYQGDLII